MQVLSLQVLSLQGICALRQPVWLFSISKLTAQLLQVNKNNMQQQLADMTAQLNALEMEHNKLTGKNSVLEMVLSSRQAQLQILHEQQKVICSLWP